MKVIVMGAGVIGVASAWYLAKAGHEVVVLERNGAPACETSFGNGGQISVSHAEPWANPSAPLKMLRWLGKEDAPLLFRMRADMQQWAWGLRFLRECGAGRSTHNMIQLLRLGTYSRTSLQELRAETGITYDHLSKGILHFYTSQKELDLAIQPARIMREYGCERHVIDAAEVVRIEPAFAPMKAMLAGATYTSTDESGDVNLFTTRLAGLCARKEVKFRFGVRVHRLRVEGGRVTGIEYADEQGAYQIDTADAYVLALGSFSRQVAATVGVPLHIYPVKGYSITLPLTRPELAPSTSLTDDEFKLVFSRFGARLRVAGTAEFSGYNMELNATRCEAITKRVLQLFPGIGEASQARHWTGLRPATPGNVPYIGRSKFANLYLNTGHGTLGWTHGCGSGRAIADIVSGRTPGVDFSFVGLDR